VAVIGIALIFAPLLLQVEPLEELSDAARGYVERSPEELGAQNVVTGIIVTYRGLDTLGEVAVLFLATTGVGFLLRRDRNGELSPGAAGGDDRTDAKAGDRKIAGAASGGGEAKAAPSEILGTGARILFPVILLFGVYIFTHGHLTPGGGFQGGVVLASAALLLMLAGNAWKIRHGVLLFLESTSGSLYVVVGILGLLLAAGFLDNRILPLGGYGTLLSAGAIPVIYSLVGLKVGAELTGILDRLKLSQEDTE
jgi:multicomponent Na+:H+ antiporter subunit B